MTEERARLSGCMSSTDEELIMNQVVALSYSRTDLLPNGTKFCN